MQLDTHAIAVAVRQQALTALPDRTHVRDALLPMKAEALPGQGYSLVYRIGAGSVEPGRRDYAARDWVVRLPITFSVIHRGKQGQEAGHQARTLLDALIMAVAGVHPPLWEHGGGPVVRVTRVMRYGVNDEATSLLPDEIYVGTVTFEVEAVV
jgi:hypothetical protein